MANSISPDRSCPGFVSDLMFKLGIVCNEFEWRYGETIKGFIGVDFPDDLTVVIDISAAMTARIKVERTDTVKQVEERLRSCLFKLFDDHCIETKVWHAVWAD